MGTTLGMVTIDCADPQKLAGFWSAALHTSVSGDYGELVFLAPPPGGQVTMGFQKVPEEAFMSNRNAVSVPVTAQRVAAHRRGSTAPLRTMPGH